MPSVTFQPENMRVECHAGETLYQIAWRSGAALATACGAKATCGLCRVKVLVGGECLTPITDAEKKHLGNVYFLTRVRLGCQTRVEGDVEVEAVRR